MTTVVISEILFSWLQNSYIAKNNNVLLERVLKKTTVLVGLVSIFVLTIPVAALQSSFFSLGFTGASVAATEDQIQRDLTVSTVSAKVGEFFEVELTHSTSSSGVEYNSVLMAVTNVTFPDLPPEKLGLHFNRVEGHKIMIVRFSATLLENRTTFITFDLRVSAGEYTYFPMTGGGGWGVRFLPGERRESLTYFQVLEGIGPVDLAIYKVWPSETVAKVRLVQVVPTSSPNASQDFTPKNITADPFSTKVGDYFKVQLSYSTSSGVEYNSFLMAVTNVTLTDLPPEELGLHFYRLEGYRLLIVKLSTTLLEKRMTFITFDLRVSAGEYTYKPKEISGIWSSMFLPSEEREGLVAFQVREGLGPVDLHIYRIDKSYQAVAKIHLAETI